jgi:hypothetical protein
LSITPKDLLGAAEDIEVRIMDLSGGNGSDPVEVVRGFSSLAHANSFARRRVRDSVEFCRMGGMTPGQVTEAWFAFGEDAVVGNREGSPPGGAWSSASELAAFAAQPCADAEERNWRILDPRKHDDDDDSDDDGSDDDGGDGDCGGDGGGE